MMHSFASNCSLPPEGTNFVSAPPLRGTLQILWTCLSVLVLCTWSVVHLNVPPQIRVRSKTQKLRRASRRLFSKIRWMLFNMLAPEWIFAKALSDFLSVRGLKARFVAQAEKDGVAWSDTHTHFADMGGFGISFDGVTASQNDVDESHDFDSSLWIKHAKRLLGHGLGESYTRCLYTMLSQASANEQRWQMDLHNSKLIAKALNGSVKDVLGPVDEDRGEIFQGILMLRANLWIPNAAQLLLIRELGIIDSLPNIDEDDLNDRSKDNSIIKVIAISQICWFDLQFLVRLCTGMINTQLEVMVFAFTFFSVASYALAWDRPKSSEYTIIQKATSYPRSPDDIIKIASQGPASLYTGLRSTLWFANHQQSRKPYIFGLPLPESSFLIAGTVTSIFGALHCIAWHFSFPSEVEQILWQASSIISAVCPIASSTLTLYVYKNEFVRVTDFLGAIVAILLLVLFIAARIFILVEVFRSLGFQPPEAFKSTWTANLPHIS